MIDKSYADKRIATQRRCHYYKSWYQKKL